jgi:hypothetical protein
MFRISKVVFVTAAVFLSGFVQADPVKDSVALELSFIKRIFETGYAPAAWKKQEFGWTMQAAYNSAINDLSTKGDLTAADYRNIVLNLVGSTRDYHVSAQFHTTEAASLPFQVSGTQGRYFITYIDEAKVDKQTFPLGVGDEIVSFGGRSIVDVLTELKAQVRGGVDSTDWRLAELYLTRRSARMGVGVPQGPIDLVFKKKDGTVVKRQMAWDYIPETVEWKPDPAPFKMLANARISKNQFLKPQMSWGMLTNYMESQAENRVAENPYSIGGRRSFVPRLGPVLWESAATDRFDAYIYKHDSGKLIGVVRIPMYDGAKGAAFNDFREIIKRFQATTDAMVIDQVNNPGGSVFYVLALMSVLSDQPIKVPDHHITLWPAMIDENVQLMKQLEKVKNDADVVTALGTNQLDGFPLTYQFAQSMLDFTRKVQDEWSAGHKLTAPLHLWGADKVNPDPNVNYTKPILLLVNELDFSGGDFFPAILQDNNRAKIMGLRTSGAGGYILGVEFPSSLGLKSFSFTGSLARRMNNKPIENLGVTPDIPYDWTVNDFQNNYVDYKAAINKAVGSL